MEDRTSVGAGGSRKRGMTILKMILASNSPRRRELLALLGIRDYAIIAPDVDETIEGTPAPEALVMALSARKASVVAERVTPDALVIAADTVVELGGKILGKPKNRQDAARMLSALSERRHRVYTGVTVRHAGKTATEFEATEVQFRALTEREIKRYIDTGEPMDKAGAYGIQGFGAMLIEGVFGDYFNVMGLPVNRLREILLRFGVDCLELAASACKE